MTGVALNDMLTTLAVKSVSPQATNMGKDDIDLC